MKKTTKIKIIITLFVILMLVLIYIKVDSLLDDSISEEKKLTTVFEDINTSTYAKVTKYIVYGTHFNIEGTLEIPQISDVSVSKANLIIKTLDNSELSFDAQCSYSDGILEFSSIDKINGGLDLETLDITKYYIFIQITFSSNEVYYYSLENSTKYEDITYYTITNENSNNKIDIEFNNYNDINYMEISVSSIEEIPDNVYDIVIDPGHGGTDSGAISNDEDYEEADLMLDLAIALQESLENLGYKVLLTRDETLSASASTEDVYADDGRVTVANESHSKLLLSLHMDSNYYDLSSGGIEIYAPNDCDLSFAKSLANNLVSTAKTNYSPLNIYKESDGVYVHNFNSAEIEVAKNSAESSGYDPYDITTSTPYLYMLRETGGIATSAYIDGRNTAYSANEYYNSNIGIESYILNVGYIDIDEDLENFLENQSLYVEAICNTIYEALN